MSRHERSQKDEIPDAGIQHSLFLNNLEEWIDEVISRDGLTDKKIIENVRESFERSIQANIDHHSFLAKNTNGNGDSRLANRHKLMAQVYQSLLK